MENETEVGGSVDRRGLACLLPCRRGGDWISFPEAGAEGGRRQAATLSGSEGGSRGRGNLSEEVKCVVVQLEEVGGSPAFPSWLKLPSALLYGIASQHTYVHTLTLLIRTTLETERKGAFSPRPLAESPVT